MNRAESLAKGNQIRSYRARIKRQIATGRLSIATLIRLPKRKLPPALERMTIFDLVRCQRGWGDVRTSKELERLEIFEGRYIVDLNHRDRLRLIVRFR